MYGGLSVKHIGDIYHDPNASLKRLSSRGSLATLRVIQAALDIAINASQEEYDKNTPASDVENDEEEGEEEEDEEE